MRQATPRRAFVVIGILLTTFLAALDGTIVGTIMPTVIADVGGLDLYPWVATAFMLASTVVTPLYGKLSDLFGHRRFIFVAIAVFLAGSALCGAARTMPELVAARAFQGAGAGGLFVMSFIVFGQIFSPEERGRMQGLLSSVWGLSSVVGPAVGGFLVQWASWRWAFYLNLPFGLLAVAMIARTLHLPAPEHPVRPKIDWLGAFLFAVGAIGTLFALLKLGEGHPSPSVWLSLVLGLAATVTFVYHQLRTPEPLMPVRLFARSIFRVPVLMGLLAGASLFSASSFLPLFVQGVLGANPTVTGTVLTMISFGWVAGSTLSGHLLNRFGFRRLAMSGAALMTLGFLLLALEPAHTTVFAIGRDNIILGLGMGCVVTSTLIAVQTFAEPRMLGAATSSVQLFRTIGGTLGLSMLGGIQLGAFARALFTQAEKFSATPALQAAYEHARAHPHAVLDPASRAALPPALGEAMQQALGSSLHAVFWLMLGLAVLNLILSAFMPTNTPREAHEAAAVAAR
ncbi:MFS transporter [bacterium]|nr:MFS transporter [bacterium]